MRSFETFPATKTNEATILKHLQADAWQLEGLYQTGLNPQKIDTGNTQVVFGKLFIYLINDNKTEKFAYKMLPGAIFKMQIDNGYAIGRISDFGSNRVRFIVDFDRTGFIVDLVR